MSLGAADKGHAARAKAKVIQSTRPTCCIRLVFRFGSEKLGSVALGYVHAIAALYRNPAAGVRQWAGSRRTGLRGARRTTASSESYLFGQLDWIRFIDSGTDPPTLRRNHLQWPESFANGRNHLQMAGINVPKRNHPSCQACCYDSVTRLRTSEPCHFDGPCTACYNA